VHLLGTAQCPKKLVNGPITKCSPTIRYFHNVLLIDVAKARVLHLPHKKIDVILISFHFITINLHEHLENLESCIMNEKLRAWSQRLYHE
jgi:hypothetical protein